jgi:hypothetical protein
MTRTIKSTGIKEVMISFDSKIDEYLTEFIQLFKEAMEAKEQNNQPKLDEVHKLMNDILSELAPVSAYLRVNAPQELNSLFNAILYKFDDRFKMRTDYTDMDKAAMEALGIHYVAPIHPANEASKSE